MREISSGPSSAEPQSPGVIVATCAVQPCSRTRRAMVPAQRNSASSGWARTLSTTPAISVALRKKRPRQLVQVEEAARQGRHETAGNPGRGLVVEGHPEREALPHHPAPQRAVAAADNPVRGEEKAGADGVRE